MPTFEPLERPILKFRLLDLEIARSVNGFTTFLPDGELEVSIRVWIARCFAPIDWCMHLQSNVEILPSEKIGSEAQFN